MQKQSYPVHPEQWWGTPIKRGTNPVTNLIEGDDAPFRDMKTLKENQAPLVVPNILLRPAYDGISVYDGTKSDAMTMPGGVGKFVLRESAARSLEEADKALKTLTGNQYQLVGLDGFRSRDRQALGFTGLLQHYMTQFGLTEDDVDDELPKFIEAVKKANGTFCYVGANTSTVQYESMMQNLKSDAGFMASVEEVANQRGTDADTVLYLYITGCANANLGRANGRNIPLDFECNPHASGGAVDAMVVDAKGRLINLVPFDCPYPEAMMGYMEQDGAYDKFTAIAWTDERPMLRDHLTKLGYPTAASFTKSVWGEFRGVQRLLYHLSRACDWVYYSEADCGENWHFEPGNIVYNPITGNVISSEPTAEQYPRSGNPGGTFQRLGREAVAVWGGSSAHRQLGLL